jgi:hypothetical protein
LSAFVQVRSLVQQPSNAETDAALLRLADLDVAQDRRGNQQLATLVVGQREDGAVLERCAHGCGDLCRALVRLEDDLAGDVLDTDADLHGGSSLLQ